MPLRAKGFHLPVLLQKLGSHRAVNPAVQTACSPLKISGHIFLSNTGPLPESSALMMRSIACCEQLNNIQGIVIVIDKLILVSFKNSPSTKSSVTENTCYIKHLRILASSACSVTISTKVRCHMF